MKSYLCTAIHEVSPISVREWVVLKNLKDEAYKYFPEVASFYFGGCENLVPEMKKARVDFTQHRPFLNLVLKYITQWGYEYALDFYCDYATELVKEYEPHRYELAMGVRRKAEAN